MIENIIVIAVVAVIVGSALFYIIREKKKGNKCIGCSAADNCTKDYCSCNKK